jgi:flagellar hook protein FlgE
MLRSLYSGISGLRAHQQMLDVTSNNIANVNTTGFQSSSVTFDEALSQTVAGATGPGVNGGTSAFQVGLGVRASGTRTDLTQGSSQATGNPSDLLINGDGYFAVSKDGSQLYTRAGDFHLDSAGHLVRPDGAILQSASGGNLDLSALLGNTYVSWSIGADGVVTGIDAAGTSTALGTVGVATFTNPGGLSHVGDTEYQPTASSGAATLGAPEAGGRGSLTAGYVEMSNVDLSQQLTNLIISERGFQANSRVITTSDEVLQTLVNLKN